MGLTVGGVTSRVGSSAAFVALIWYLQVKTQSPALLGLFLSVYSFGKLGAQLYSGLLADRMDRGRAMIYGDVASAILFIVVAVLVTGNHVNVAYLLGVYIVIALVGQLNPIASQSIVPDIVRHELLIQANSFMQAVYDLGAVLGPIIGASMVSDVAGATLAFFANAGSYVISALSLLWGRVSSKPERTPSSVWQDVVEGFRIVGSHRVVRMLAVVGLFIHIAIMPVEWVLLSTLVKEVLHGTALQYGVAVTLINVGAIGSGFLLGMAPFRMPPKDMLQYGVILEMISFLGMGLAPTFWVLWISAAIHGIAETVLFMSVLSFMQSATDPDIRGRAFSGVYLAVELGSVLGLAATGYATQLVSARAITVALACFTLITIPLIRTVRTAPMSFPPESL